MADDDPFKRAVAALKAGAAADKAFVAAEQADRAALLEAVRQYRRGVAAIAEAFVALSKAGVIRVAHRQHTSDDELL